jgi:hypothetical protein
VDDSRQTEELAQSTGKLRWWCNCIGIASMRFGPAYNDVKAQSLKKNTQNVSDWRKISKRLFSVADTVARESGPCGPKHKSASLKLKVCFKIQRSQK